MSSPRPRGNDELPAEECALCHDSGWLKPEAWETRRGEYSLIPCPCLIARRERRAWEEGVAASRMGRDLRDHTFASFERTIQPRAFAGAIAFANSLDKWLVLYGVTGAGKTHLLCAIANDLIRKGRRPVYWSIPDLLAHLQDGYGDNTFAARLEAARGADILLLDEWGVEKISDDRYEILYRIVNHRMNDRLPLAIATNLKHDQFPARFRSRFNDPDRVVGIRMNPRDYRTGEMVRDDAPQGRDAR
jgi:DNA replication protein DnaC